MRAIGLLFLGLLLGACRNAAPAAGACESDAQCPLGNRCQDGTCICVSDAACDEEEFCNSAGQCQERAGCVLNSECTEGTFCDIVSGECLVGPSLVLQSNCSLASHCPFGSICTAGRCVEGCFDSGDCPLGQVCSNGQCFTGDNICEGDGFCEYGERCQASECRADRRGPYCRGCTQRTGANPEPCDEPRNFCLVNNSELGGFTQFCGVDCSLGQPCPNGYGCANVVLLTESACTFSAQCKCNPANITFATSTCTVAAACDPRLPNGDPDPNASGCTVNAHPDCNAGGEGDAACLVLTGQTNGSCTCATNDDCEAGAACVDGACCTGMVREEKECIVGEGRVSGFCTCATDDDCPRDVCDGSRGACAISGNPCTPGNGDCGAIPCVNGGCLIGANCAPIQGLSCGAITGE